MTASAHVTQSLQPHVDSRRPPRAAAIPVRFGLKWSFLLFVISMPVESAKLPGMPETLTFAKLFGYLFFLCAFLQPRVAFRRPSAAVAWFMVYVGVVTLLSRFDGSPAATRYVLQLVQLVIFTWAATNLLRIAAMRRAALIAFIGGVVALAFVQALVPTVAEEMSAGRISALSENPNAAGAFFALAIVAALAVRREYADKRPTLRLMMLAAAGMVVVQLVRTGSRSSMLGLAAGLLVYIFASDRFAAKVKAALMSAVVIGAALYVAWTAEGFIERWTAAFERKDLSRREEIFPASLDMIGEKLLAGWGPHEHLVELGRRFGVELLEEHNLLLFVFAEGGLVAGVPFVLGLLFTALATVRARRAHVGVGPMALLLALMVVNMANVYHVRKIHWLVIAVCIASAPERGRGARGVRRGKGIVSTDGRANPAVSPRRLGRSACAGSDHPIERSSSPPVATVREPTTFRTRAKCVLQMLVAVSRFPSHGRQPSIWLLRSI